jgi:hypothetical protein
MKKKISDYFFTVSIKLEKKVHDHVEFRTKLNFIRKLKMIDQNFNRLKFMHLIWKI